MIDVSMKVKFRDATHPVFCAIQNAMEIKPPIGLIQSAHESNWGVSQLATDGKNIFSITPGDDWLAFKRKEKTAKDVPTWGTLGIETVNYPTREYSKHAPDHIRYWEFPGDILEKKPDGKGGSILLVDRHFRKYATWDESAWDWARKLAHNARYVLALVAARDGDVSKYIDAIRASGYATDPAYAEGLIATAKTVESLPKAVA